MDERPGQPGPSDDPDDPKLRASQQGDVPTMRVPDPPDPPPPSSDPYDTSRPIDDSRFVPGTLLASRYRIVGRLGRGGMGEVYRADDLKLGQSVALKFLPPSLARDPATLRRFHDEVRIARDIAHPNVCRTYDIGEVDGEHFISMEYVDGEDLSALIRRIGRLPKDKAIQIARQLCGGLAAAHDKGVLHRDLKPANIMLDGRGHVRITDFGIAALADELDGRDVRAGTPAYMAPEQLAGESVSARSDIYSLGLVLYEVFTGREAYRAGSVGELKSMRTSGAPSAPSSFVDDMDPLAERVILRCLENEPRDRPPSVISVAAALPGGDPLALALAAGETPSPEMVAQAGESGGLQPALALSALGVLVVLLLAGAWLSDQVRLDRTAAMELPPAVLAHRAGDIARRLGHDRTPADTAFGFDANWMALRHVAERETSMDGWRQLARGPLPLVYFWYRSSPESLAPRNAAGTVQWDDPPFTEPGMIRMSLDSDGRLQHFEALPPRVRAGAGGGDGANLDANAGPDPDANTPDWPALFELADLDRAGFTPAEPAITPPVYCEQRAAWNGDRAGAEDYAIHLEAAALGDRVVWFTTFWPWNDPRRDAAGEVTATADRVARVFFPIVFGLVLLGGGLLALRNLRVGRGDRRGATRLAIYVLLVYMGLWLFQADHTLGGSFPLEPLFKAFGRAAGAALFVWILYIAIEPFARRYWPRSIISWTRVLSGRWRDPLVGRDVLAGAIAGAACYLLEALGTLANGWVGAVPRFGNVASWGLEGGRQVIAGLFDAQTGIGVFFGLFVLLLLLRIVLRRPWLAIAAFSALILTVFTQFFTVPWPEQLAAALTAAVIVMTAVRFGLLSLLVLAFVVPTLLFAPATLDFSTWYAPAGLVGFAAVLGLAAYGFWIALAGQPLFRDQLET